MRIRFRDLVEPVPAFAVGGSVGEGVEMFDGFPVGYIDCGVVAGVLGRGEGGCFSEVWGSGLGMVRRVFLGMR